MLKSRNLVKKNIVFKLDVEGGEFPALKYFPLEYLDYIDQLVMEIHFDKWAPESWGNLDILRSLSEKFYNVNYHMNNFGCFSKYPKIEPYRKLKSHALEVTLVNKKLLKLKSESRSYKMHPLNTINNAD